MPPLTPRPTLPARPLACVAALALALVVVACGNTNPSGSTPANVEPTPTPTEPASPTPTPTPTPIPTPPPTMPPFEAKTVFPAGWTLVASDTRLADGVGEVKVLSTIGPQYAVAVACTGDSPISVHIRANGRSLDKAGVDLRPIDVPCPATNATPELLEFDFDAGDYHGVSLSIDTQAPEGTDYIVLIASHG